MSLLETLPYSEYKKAKALKVVQCESIAKLAKLNISFHDVENAGEHLLKSLDRSGCTIHVFNRLMSSLQRYRPQSKIAILIANDKYKHLSKLATPSIDCDSLGSNLKSMGFVVVTVKNTSAYELRMILMRISELIPEDSYCFTFYAGHGCQICNTKCMLGIDCPQDNIERRHCVTENFALKVLEKCKLDLCVFIMDMCRVYLDRENNPQIYASMTEIEDYTVNKNLLIGYSTQSSQAAYEVLEIECSTTLDSDVTYELKTGDTGRIVPGASQYVNALCTRITENCDVSSMLDKVHGDVENSLKKQRPIKVQCGTDRRYLYDVATGNTMELIEKLKEALNKYREFCNVF